MNLINQLFIRWTLYLVITLQVVIINNFIILNINVFMILNLQKNANNETNNITSSDKEISSYGLNKLLKVATENSFVFNQMFNLGINFYSNLSNIGIRYFLKLQIPIMYRQFFRLISLNPDFEETFCNDLNKPFHFACQKRKLENSSWDCFYKLT